MGQLYGPTPLSGATSWRTHFGDSGWASSTAYWKTLLWEALQKSMKCRDAYCWGREMALPDAAAVDPKPSAKPNLGRTIMKGPKLQITLCIV